MENEKNVGFGFGSLCLAFLTGATAATVVVLLTAPESGADTRKRLARIASQSKNAVGRIPATIKDSASAAGTAVKEVFVEAYGNNDAIKPNRV